MLPTKCGINLIKAAYDHAIGDEVSGKTMPNGYRTGIKWINASQDYMAARESGDNLLKWLLSMRGEKVYAIWSSDDIYPLAVFFLYELPGKIFRNFKI